MDSKNKNISTIEGVFPVLQPVVHSSMPGIREGDFVRQGFMLGFVP